MAISRRYRPEISAADINVFGYDFSPIIPPGVGLVEGSLQFNYNTNPPTAAAGELTAGPVSWYDRTLYATVTAQPNAFGKDFQLVWTAFDSQGNVWHRTGLVLCAFTS